MFARALRVSNVRLAPALVILLNLAAMPALNYSFLGLGLLLPVFAVLWGAVSDEGTGDPA